MRITFIGADHEVTGSCHYLEAGGHSILVDYGMEQGRNVFENEDLPVRADQIDYVFLTHAHIDHSGLLPLLSARGFHGRIFATRATCDLCDIMLQDSAGIQEFEAEWRNRKGKRKGEEPYEPFYTMEDALKVLERFVPCEYDRIYDITQGIRVRFTDIGHLLGSAAVELWLKEGEEERKIVFSGDIGNEDQPLLRNPERITEADYLLIESTYGDRSHEKVIDYVSSLAEVLQRTFDRGGNVIIPSFAVGRTQEMLYFFRQIKERGLIKRHAHFPVYVDSPLATKATGIFNEHTRDCFDEEAALLLSQGINPIAFEDLRLTETADESKALNMDMTPKVILSASGMCEAGRIKHHLKHNLWRPECTILFVGYQAEGTLGRALVDGAREVKLFNEPIAVRAEILQLPGISGHADREGLLDWAGGFTNPPKRCFVVHGEDEVTDSFARLLTEKLGWKTMAPFSGTIYDLVADVCVKETAGIPYVKKDAEGHPIETSSSQTATPAAPYARLLRAAERLASVVRKARGYANKDLAKFTDQLINLCDKWE